MRSTVLRHLLPLAALWWLGAANAATETLVVLGPPSGPSITESGPVLSSQSASGSEPNSPWYAWSLQAFSASTLGTLRVEGSAAVTYFPQLEPPGSLGSGPGGQAFAAASATDVVTVNSPGRTGQIGKMIVVLNLEGSVATEGSAFAQASARAEFGYGTSSGLGFSWAATDSTDEADFVGVTITRPNLPPTLLPGSPYGRFVESFPFVVGEQGFFSFELQGRSAIAVDPPRSSGRSIFELGRSFTWGGIQAVEVDGVSVPFSVQSASGLDWALPVPEPATGSMLLLGICAVAACARRRLR